MENKALTLTVLRRLIDSLPPEPPLLIVPEEVDRIRRALGFPRPRNYKVSKFITEAYLIDPHQGP